MAISQGMGALRGKQLPDTGYQLLARTRPLLIREQAADAWVTQAKAWVTQWKTLGDPVEISA